MIVSVPDHGLSFYLDSVLRLKVKGIGTSLALSL